LVLPIEEDSLGVNINMDEPDKSIFILRCFYFQKVKDIGLKLNLSPEKVESFLII